MIKKISGGVCAPKKFLASGIHVGIKRNSSKPDLGIIHSELPAVAAGVFTLNQVKAAPVLLTQEHLKKGALQTIVVNSGNANACTGKQGMQHAKQMAETVAHELNTSSECVAVASTGVIGMPLPIDLITQNMHRAITMLSNEHNDSIARAIMTTDTFPKSIAVEFMIGDKSVRIGGVAKGSGMIHPNMATMLAFITTDASIDQPVLQQALTEANKATFNMISVDGDCSTNDTVIILANGAAENNKITSIDDTSGSIFYEGLVFVLTFLAKEIARDGEGSKKIIEVHVKNARTLEQARLAARAVTSSSLVKTAIFGNDANWGRIACALGYSGADIVTELMSIYIGDLLLLSNGNPLPFDESTARDALSKDTVVITVDLRLGDAKATAWGCELSHGYININASYRS